MLAYIYTTVSNHTVLLNTKETDPLFLIMPLQERLYKNHGVSSVGEGGGKEVTQQASYAETVTTMATEIGVKFVKPYLAGQGGYASPLFRSPKQPGFGAKGQAPRFPLDIRTGAGMVPRPTLTPRSRLKLAARSQVRAR